MRTLSLCLILLLLFPLVAFSQTDTEKKAQEFEKKLKEAGTPDEKVSVLMEAAKYWFISDTTRALKAIANVKAIAAKEKNPYYQGCAITREASIYLLHDKDKSMRLFHTADSILSKVETPKAYEQLFTLWYNYSLLLGQDKDYQFFIDISFEKVLPFAEKSGDKNLLALAYIRLGTLYYNIGDYDKAEEYNNLAAKTLMANNIRNHSLFTAYTGLVDTWATKNDPQNKEKAFDTLKKAEELLPVLKSTGNFNYILKFYRTAAKYYRWVGKMPESYAALDSARINAERYNENYEIYLTQMDLVENLRAEKNYPKLEKLLNKLLHDKYTTSVPLNKKLIISHLSETEKNLGKYESAYSYLQEYGRLNDSIAKVNLDERVADLDKKYQTAEKEKRIALLKSNNEKQQIAIISIVIITLLIIAFAYFLFQQRSKRIKQQLIMAQQAKEIATSQALIDGEEQERSRIARELHDGLSGKLTGIKIKLEETPNDETTQISKLMGEVITELRNISHNLTPMSLSMLGLDVALHNFAAQMNTAKTSVELYTHGLNELTDRKTELYVYRIIQELITNASKHSDASVISAQCTFNSPLLYIYVEDNGTGFNAETEHTGIGLSNVKTRVDFLNNTSLNFKLI